ncbi:hypothetical protein GF373_00235, partial [bacterium]|nr:hypothetical protein [bacterium]
MEQKNNKLETMLSIVRFSVDHPKTLTWIMVVLAIVFAAMIPWIQVDTDPENMLDEHEPVRLFHDNMKEEFTLYDMVVVGVVNEEHEDGVF